jgi:UDP-N-acetylmuramoylalanine--D-glutamate ligase
VDALKLKDAALSLRGKRVLVAGLGVFGGGTAAVQYLYAEGADVVVTDLKPEETLTEPLRRLQGCDVAYRLGGHEIDDFIEADLVVANPAIPYRSAYLQAAVDADIPVTTEIGLFAARFPGRVVAVTGTSGKTTTTTLLGEMISNAIPNTLVGGNMGVSLLSNLATSDTHTTAVLELSSFQLRYLGMMAWRPDIAVVTNFAPNHLDVHEDLEDYKACKHQLIAHQDEQGIAVLNIDDESSASWETRADIRLFGFGATEADGVYVRSGSFVSLQGGRVREICGLDDLGVPGRHNQSNACAAAGAAIAAGVGLSDVADVLRTFRGVEHRLEFCRQVDGVAFFNDSIATSPERTIVALEALTCPVVLIAGGSDKGLDYTDLGEAIGSRVKRMILLGDTAEKIRAAVLGPSVEKAVDLETAVRLAVAAAAPGDAVLLSPASASYDMFTNFEARGLAFKTIVATL